MANSASIDRLVQNIERLISAHMAEVRGAAELAISRAVGASSSAPQKPGWAQRTSPPSSSASKTKFGGTPRRSPAELEELAERLYRTVSEKAGESMQAFSGELGVTARELQRPMGKLKEAGHVRSVGERQATRYFPMARPSTPAT